jgi:methyltransferase
MIGLAQWIVLGVALWRGIELLHANRNTRRLLAQGAREVGARHYPLFVLLHGAWLAALLLFTPPEAPIYWGALGLFLLLQFARVWVIASLGVRWTTRILVLPDAPLVRRGPYRWLRHPNYAIVATEIVVLPLAFGNWALALIFGLLNLFLLRHRIRVEEAALGMRHEAGTVGPARSDSYES